MFTIIIQTSFTAQHQILFQKSGPEPLHDHNWIVEVAVQTPKLDKDGLGIDFHVLKNKTNKIIKNFEGKKLENLDYFKKLNTSAENLAKYIYNTLETQLDKTVKLKYVEITEEKGCRVRYNCC